tara:strand:- start:12290 stop:12514 length:225 start_codon:yes stop_codon:yes gene_type:complete
MTGDEKITIDGKDYELSKMSDEAKEQLNNVRVVDQEIERLQMKLAIAQTAKATYGQALMTALDINNDADKKLQI